MLLALISFLLDDDTHSLCLLGCSCPENGAAACIYHFIFRRHGDDVLQVPR